eukprot:scaffold12519_cov23-Tisochrysis_lutea.AAC.1
MTGRPSLARSLSQEGSWCLVLALLAWHDDCACLCCLHGIAAVHASHDSYVCVNPKCLHCLGQPLERGRTGTSSPISSQHAHMPLPNKDLCVTVDAHYELPKTDRGQGIDGAISDKKSGCSKKPKQHAS